MDPVLAFCETWMNCTFIKCSIGAECSDGSAPAHFCMPRSRGAGWMIAVHASMRRSGSLRMHRAQSSSRLCAAAVPAVTMPAVRMTAAVTQRMWPFTDHCANPLDPDTHEEAYNVEDRHALVPDPLGSLDR